MRIWPGRAAAGGLLTRRGGLRTVPAPDGAGRPLKSAAQLLQGPLLNAGNIAARDAKALGHHPLRLRAASLQAIAQADDRSFPRGEHGAHQAVKPFAFHPCVNFLDNGVIHRHSVQNCEGVSVLVRVDGFIERNILGGLFSAAEEHEDLVLDAPGGVTGKPYPFTAVETVNGLDEANRANRDQILLVILPRIIFFDDVGNQAQVVLDELLPGRLAALAISSRQRFSWAADRARGKVPPPVTWRNK